MWVIAAVVIAIPVGLFWGEGATSLELLPKLILRALTALAAPLVVLAILSAIVTNEVRGRQGALMMFFYLINTLVAMLIGLTLTNLIRPGRGASLVEPGAATKPLVKKTATEILLDLMPRSIGEPFTQNHLAQLVLLTLALGIGLVKIRDSQKTPRRHVVPGRHRSAHDRLRALDEGLALGGGPGAAGRLRDRGRQRRPERGDEGLRLADLADCRRGPGPGDPGDLVSASDVGRRADVARGGFWAVRST